MQDRDQIRMFNDLDIRHGGCRRGIGVKQFGPMERRPQELRVQHARTADIGCIFGGAHDIFTSVEAHRGSSHDTEISRLPQDGLVTDVSQDAASLRKFRVGNTALRIGDLANPATSGRQIPLCDTKPDGREADQHDACLRGGGTQYRAEHARRRRPERSHVPGATLGVTEHHIDGREVDIQFFGRDLRLGRQDALPHFDLSGEHRNAVVRADQDCNTGANGAEEVTPGACI